MCYKNKIGRRESEPHFVIKQSLEVIRVFFVLDFHTFNDVRVQIGALQLFKHTSSLHNRTMPPNIIQIEIVAHAHHGLGHTLLTQCQISL